MTPKEERFVQEYLVDLNATQAAMRAGYSAKTAKSQGHELLGKPAVAEAVAAAQAARAARVQVTADQVLRELVKLGFSDIRKAITWQANVVGIVDEGTDKQRLAVTNQVQLKDSDAIDDDTAAAIAEIGQDSKGGLRLKLHDKRAALVDIGKHLGMFTDRVQHTGADGGPIETVTRIELVGPPE